MDSHFGPRSDSGVNPTDVSEVHNASVDEDAAQDGACAQVHLPTGAMCVMRHGHDGSCEFIPAAQADAVLAMRKTAEHW